MFKKDQKAIKDFKHNGSDMYSMLKKTVEGSGNSWAIRFAYAQFRQKKYSLMPFKSFVKNVGFGVEGTNTKYVYSRFEVEMDEGYQRNFLFDSEIIVDKRIEKLCYRYHSLIIRIYSKIRYIIG